MRTPRIRTDFTRGVCVICRNNMDDTVDTLKAWLHYLFPDHEICCHTNIPRHIQESRGLKEYKRFTLDARIEELSLIVELDIVKDYMYANRIVEMRKRDKVLEEMGYKVVHIPFWVTLSAINIYHYFGLTGVDGCSYPSGFWPVTDRAPDLTWMPANFSQIGYNKFATELMSLPTETQVEVIDSIKRCVDKYEIDIILPPEYLIQIQLPGGK